MKTKNVILLGVVGVGAVGAYMYFSKKRKMNNLVASAQSQMIASITPTTTSSATNDGIQPTDYALNLENAQRVMSDIAWLKPRANKFIGKKYLSELNQKYADLQKLGFAYNEKTNLLEPIKGTASTPALDLVNAKRILSDINWLRPRIIMGDRNPRIIEKYAQLSKLGYKLDSKNQLVKI